jgi:hypothetical protein
MMEKLNCLTVKLQTFAYMNTCERTPLEFTLLCIGNREKSCIFNTCYIISVLFSTKEL